MSSPSLPAFEEGEKVLCFHGPLIYEGKVLQLQKAGKLGYAEIEAETLYLVHYSGWSKKWDEFVHESRLLKHNDENLKLQKEKKDEAAAMNKKTGKKSGKGNGAGKSGNPVTSKGSAVASSPIVDTTVPSSSNQNPISLNLSRFPETSSLTATATPPPKPRSIDTLFRLAEASYLSQNWGNNNTGRDEMRSRRFEVPVGLLPGEEEFQPIRVTLALPCKIQSLLLKDHEQIMKNKMLTVIPGRKTVVSILEDFKQHLIRTGDKTPRIDELISALREQVSLYLGKQLIYRFERPQYKMLVDRIKTDDPCISDEDIEEMLPNMYGPIYIIRYFSKLSNSLSITSTERLWVLILGEFFKKVMSYLEDRSDEFLVPGIDYEKASEEYLEVSGLNG